MSDLTVDPRWVNHIHARDALAELGYGEELPSGRENVCDFLEKLLEHVDRRAAIVPTEMVELVTEWEAALQNHRYGFCDDQFRGPIGSGLPKNWLRGMPSDIPRRLLSSPVAGRRMTFEDCAWLLHVSVIELERVLWPYSLDRLEYAAGAVLGRGAPLNVATCKAYGVAIYNLREYLQLRHGWRTPNGRRPTIGKTHLREGLRLVDEEGLSNRQAFERLREMGVQMDDGYYDSFVKSLRRMRAEVAA